METTKKITFFDIEVNPTNGQIIDIGSIDSDNVTFHKNSIVNFIPYLENSDFVCGHNILNHDLEYIQKHYNHLVVDRLKPIDTLLLSPLLFPKSPYHRLVKDDKLQVEERSNPLNDAKNARDLFYDEVNTFVNLPADLKIIFYNLLQQQRGFSDFFEFTGYSEKVSLSKLEDKIRLLFEPHICANSDVAIHIVENPVPLAYALALIFCDDKFSITPPWVAKNHPDVERVIFLLRSNLCINGCNYCNAALDPYKAINRHFGFSTFRSYGDEPLQEKAVRAAINNKSICAIFPTGGGKSITFQLPALMAAENTKGLTVIISPLQSLMKDQVDNLEKRGITDAVTINGLLDPIERSKAVERIENGTAFLLYISPESLRSNTIERLLLKRRIERFVIDEAHCFSAWGQDFRVDYLYIADFIKSLQIKKNLVEKISVSCFTATAKPRLIEDIKNYFKESLDIDLELFTANASRTNLKYRVFQKDNEEDKYNQLRTLIEFDYSPTIVYVSRTKRASELAKRLANDGFNAKPYHGKMDKDEKMANQNAFMSGEVSLMVATSAFGMGVDKSNVGKVIHFDISDSLENYVQEAGRAGRDENIQAECFVLFNEEDLNKHFILLNQTKISSKEINQVWKAIKDLTKTRAKVSNSALEIARKAGWDENLTDIETRVTTAISALEQAGYLKRGQNFPRIFANSILSKNAQDAINNINLSPRFNERQKETAIRIIKRLFSSKSKRLSTDEVAESRIDYISDQLGIVKEEIIRVIDLLKQEGILAQTRDLTAFIKRGENLNKSLQITTGFKQLEDVLFAALREDETTYHLKELNELCINSGIADCTPNRLNTVINFWTIKNWIKRQNHRSAKNHMQMVSILSKGELKNKLDRKLFISNFITEYLYRKSSLYKSSEKNAEEVLVEFSVVELKDAIENNQGIFKNTISLDDIEDALFFLSRIEAVKIEGGFLVIYNKLTIDRIEKNNRIQYKESDYEKLRQFYQQKVQQIHIVGEYAKKMIRNYNDALQFVDDYFRLTYSSFLSKYFPGSRQEDINRTLTPEKFKKLFGELSVNQLEIIKDSSSQYIVVAAGPGSGKTKVLVHKLASLILTEDIKHEQLLMLAFSRAAVNEFKKRLADLIGNAAYHVGINTFHSYCFDLLGRVGNLNKSDEIIKFTISKIRAGDVEPSKITKAVLVVDEAQDMNADE